MPAIPSPPGSVSGSSLATVSAAATAVARAAHRGSSSTSTTSYQSPRAARLDHFATVVVSWEPDEVRTLTTLLRKLELSKASAAAQERTRAGRRGARLEMSGVAGEPD